MISCSHPDALHDAASVAASPEVVVVAAAAIIDHVVVTHNEQQLAAVLGGISVDQMGGSQRVSAPELHALVRQATTACGLAVNSTPAGSAANVARNLARQGLSVRLLTARAADEAGDLFVSGMRAAGVDVSRVINRAEADSTGASLIVSHSGQRTMRTHISPLATLLPELLTADMFNVQHDSTARRPLSPWAFVSAYSAYQPRLLERACDLARQAGRKVMLDMASFEVVHKHVNALLQLLETGAVDAVVCNEDEAAALSTLCGARSSPVLGAQAVPQREGRWLEGSIAPAELRAAQILSGMCDMVVLTLGARGCLAVSRGAASVHHQPASYVADVCDATGAGDAFTAALLFGLVKGCASPECTRMACAAGAAAVQVVGADIGAEVWKTLGMSARKSSVMDEEMRHGG